MEFYALYDKIAEKWMPPSMMENDAVALRQFERDIVRNPKVDHPEDFSLWRLGKFDEYEKEGNPIKVDYSYIDVSNFFDGKRN